jgi:hypothetical protein
MIVSLHEPRVIHLPNGITLYSGANNVNTEKFMENAKHPTIQNMIVEGIISFDEPVKGKEIPAAQHLADLKPKEATDLVLQTIDSELLNSWLKLEKRAAVKTAIEKQLKALSDPTIRRSGEPEGESSNSAHEELKPDFSKD